MNHEFVIKDEYYKQLLEKYLSLTEQFMGELDILMNKYSSHLPRGFKSQVVALDKNFTDKFEAVMTNADVK